MTSREAFIEHLTKRGFASSGGLVTGERARAVAMLVADRVFAISPKTADLDTDFDDGLPDANLDFALLDDSDLPRLAPEIATSIPDIAPIEFDDPPLVEPNLHDRQLALWQQWQRTNDDQYVEELLESLTPLFKYMLNKYTQYPIPYNILMHKSMMLARDAMPKYDPDKSKLSTFVMNQIRPLDRFVKQYQNVSYIPEFLSKEFGRYEAAQQALSDNLGHVPNDQEMADFMKMPVGHIERIRAAKTQSMLASGNVSEHEDQLMDSTRSKLDDSAVYLRAQLSGKERQAFDKLFAYRGGHLMADDLAKELGVNASDIYAWRRRWTRLLSGRS